MTPSEAVKNALEKPMDEEHREYVEELFGGLEEGEDTMLTAAVTGIVTSAIQGNVSAFGMLMDLYGEENKKAARKPDGVLQLVMKDREDKKSASGG